MISRDCLGSLLQYPSDYWSGFHFLSPKSIFYNEWNKIDFLYRAKYHKSGFIGCWFRKLSDFWSNFNLGPKLKFLSWNLHLGLHWSRIKKLFSKSMIWETFFSILHSIFQGKSLFCPFQEWNSSFGAPFGGQSKLWLDIWNQRPMKLTSRYFDTFSLGNLKLVEHFLSGHRKVFHTREN